MSTPEFDLHKALVISSNPSTGIATVKIPTLLGASVSLDVPSEGLTRSGSSWNVPAVGTTPFVAVSLDRTKVYWVAPNFSGNFFDYISFNTESTFAVNEGQVAWNEDEGTLDIGMHGGEAVLQVGQEVVYYVKNQTGSAIPNGTVVRFDGSLGASGRLKVAPFLGNKTYKSAYIMGITTETIPDGEDGYVTHFGKVRGLDTTEDSEGNALVDGDLLYASATVPGGYTKVEPAAPNNRVLLAAVVNAHAQNGVLFVRPTFVADLLENERVNAPSITDGDILVYNGTSGVFENQPKPSSPVGTLIDWVGNSSALASVISDGWLSCDGSTVSRTTYSALFDVLGTTFGAGDGSTTFGLPDLRQRVTVGLGTGAAFDTVGETGGTADATLVLHDHSIDHNHPSTTTAGDTHSHSIQGYGVTAFDSTGGRYAVTADSQLGTSRDISTETDTHSHTVDLPNYTGTSGNAGSSATDKNYQPYMVVYKLIRAW